MNFIERIKINKKKIKTNENIIKKLRTNVSKSLTFDQSFPNKLTNNVNSIIPLNIFQTWHTKILPQGMAETVLQIKKMNPRFKHYLFDDADCEHFIATHFKPDVLDAYRRLIPGAYKADLWRYCVLFIHGGIYLDIKYKPINNFRFINLTESEHLCYDTDNANIYNAILICKPKNKLCFKAIREIVKNVHNKYYGNCFLDPTGPGLLKKCIKEDNRFISTIDLKHKVLGESTNFRVIKYENYYILKQYDQYINDYNRTSKTSHYSQLWNERRIYL